MSATNVAIEYRLAKSGSELDVDAIIDVFRDSGLGAYRPIDDREIIGKMFAHANLVVTAWSGETMIGVARSLSDFCFCTYLSDLAVRRAFQKQGVGRELMKRTQKAGGTATIFLFAAPEAEAYYPRVGFAAGSGFTLSRMQRLR